MGSLALGWLACVPPTDTSTPKPADRPEDLATEPCNGVDDDRDGKVDEGNDLDQDGIPACFDAEDCDGVDNDGDGRVDEDFDADSDGIGDCLDTEDCDGVDNDGDGDVDEGFGDCDPCNGVDDNGDGVVDEGHDGDTDGIPDCADTEDCDGVDNDGDGQVDEGLDHDWDGVCDALDAEVCDGWDNDGDGVLAYDLDGDGAPDCWVPEACNGLDDDGDGANDEGFADADADGVADCLASCGTPSSYAVCGLDSGAGAFSCPLEDPLAVVSTVNGVSADVELAGATTLMLTGRATDWAGILWHLSDSPTCDGFGGDAGTSSYDGEAHNDGYGGVTVYDGDLGPDVVLVAVPALIAQPADRFFVQVCQGWVAFRSESADGPLEAASPALFQWDGTEIDPESSSGSNDTALHLGIGRTVADPLRNGIGVDEVVVVVGR